MKNWRTDQALTKHGDSHEKIGRPRESFTETISGEQQKDMNMHEWMIYIEKDDKTYVK